MRERKNTEIRKLVKMTYREFRPGPLLQKHVECFWTIQSTPAAETLPDRIYPDGCMDIIFNFADPIRNPDAQIVNTSRAFVVGNMTTFSAVQATGKLDLLAVRFHPGGIFPFLQMPLHEITDRFADLVESHREFVDGFVERLSEQPTDAHRVKLLEHALLAKLFEKRNVDPISEFTVHRLLATRGSVSVQRMASECGLSLRQLERKFKERVGIAPKLLAQIIRFRQTQTEIRQSAEKDLTVIAYECGYFDHAHMTREFNRFAGLSPSFFRKSL